jgi:pimeloyl-ACP methyl ester carboxylesterase
MDFREWTGAWGRATSWGSGPEVVFLSNPLADPLWWTESARASLGEAGYTLTTLEPKAPTTDWQAVVASVGTFICGRPSPVSLVGWSLGATIAQEVALGYPEYVTSATLLASYARQNEIDRIYQQCWDLLGDADDSLDPLRLALGLLTAFPAERLSDDAFVARMQHIQPQWAGRPDPAKRQQASDYIAGYQDRLTTLSELRRPCLVMGFELDTDTFAARAREVAEAIPVARYVEIGDAGHLAPVTHPSEVWPVVLDFLNHHTAEQPDSHGETASD